MATRPACTRLTVNPWDSNQAVTAATSESDGPYRRPNSSGFNHLWKEGSPGVCRARMCSCSAASWASERLSSSSSRSAGNDSSTAPMSKLAWASGCTFPCSTTRWDSSTGPLTRGATRDSEDDWAELPAAPAKLRTEDNASRAEVRRMYIPGCSRAGVTAAMTNCGITWVGVANQERVSIREEKPGGIAIEPIAGNRCLCGFERVCS